MKFSLKISSILLISAAFILVAHAASAFTGAVSRTYTLQAQANDPDGNDIYYTFSWGDGSPQTRVPAAGYVPSGTLVNGAHAWNSSSVPVPPNVYSVYVVTCDTSDSCSAQSDIVTSDIQLPTKPGPITLASGLNPSPTGTFSLTWTASDPHSLTSVPVAISQYDIWRQFNGGSIVPTGSSVTNTFSENNIADGSYVYYVIARDDTTPANLSLQSDSYAITVNRASGGAPPVANFDFCMLAPTTVQFEDTSTDDGTITTRSWNFGDGTPLSSLRHPVHNFTTGATSIRERLRHIVHQAKKVVSSFWYETRNRVNDATRMGRTTPSALAAGIEFRDTFTTGANSELSDNTPDIGSGWQKLYQDGSGAGANDIRLWVMAATDDVQDNAACGNSQGVLYQTGNLMSSPDYEVSVRTVNSDSGDNYNYLAARIQDQNNFYALQWNGTGSRLHLRSGGVWSQISSVFPGFADGSTVTLKVEGTTISVLSDGVPQFNRTNSAIASAGRAGMGMGALSVSTYDCELQMLDDFQVNVTGSGDTTAPTVSSPQARPDNYTGSGEWDNDIEIHVTFTASDDVAVTSCNAAIGVNPPNEAVEDLTNRRDRDTGVEGLNTYYVQCRDAANNNSLPVVSDTIGIDLARPAVNTFTVEGQSAGGQTTISTAGNDPTIVWNVSDALSAVQSVQFYRATYDTVTCPTGTEVGCSWSQPITASTALSGSIDDTTAATSGIAYWYGIHVNDNATNCALENNQPCTGTGNPVRITMNIAINNPPVANYSYCRPNPSGQPNTVRFTDTSTDDGAIQSWNWTFDDFSPSSSAQNPEHTFSSAGAMVFDDTFTQSSDIALGSRIPELGGGYTVVTTNGTCTLYVESDAGVDNLNALTSRSSGGCGDGEGQLYRTNNVINSADYTVNVTMTAGDGSDDMNVIACRIQDSNNLYAARFNTADSDLYINNGGTWDPIGSDGPGIGNGSAVTLRCQGANITLEDDGVAIVSATDATHAAAGYAGIGMGDVVKDASLDDDISDQRLDNFRVITLGASPPYTVTLTATDNGGLQDQESKDIIPASVTACGGGGPYTVTLTVTDEGSQQDNVQKAVNTATAPLCTSFFTLTSAVATKCTEAGLTWTAAKAANNYTLYRRTCTNPPGCTVWNAWSAVLPNITTLFTYDTTAAQETTYQYYLAANLPSATTLDASTASPACTGSWSGTGPVVHCPLAVTTPNCAPAITPLPATSGCGAIALSWSATPGATSYRVWRAIGTDNFAGAFELTSAPGLNQLSYTDTDIVPDVVYYYYVTDQDGTMSVSV